MATLITKTCANCGRKFITRDSNKIYCDIKCEEYARDGIKIQHEDKIDYKEKMEGMNLVKICPNCGKQFTKKYEESYQVFLARKSCCASCGQQLRIKERKKGKQC